MNIIFLINISILHFNKDKLLALRYNQKVFLNLIFYLNDLIVVASTDFILNQIKKIIPVMDDLSNYNLIISINYHRILLKYNSYG